MQQHVNSHGSTSTSGTTSEEQKEKKKTLELGFLCQIKLNKAKVITDRVKDKTLMFSFSEELMNLFNLDLGPKTSDHGSRVT